MGAAAALVPVLLQVIEQGITLAPTLIAEIKSAFAVGAGQTAVTADQEAAQWDVLTKLNAAVQDA